MARAKTVATRLTPIQPPKIAVGKRGMKFVRGLPDHDWRIKGTLEPPKMVLCDHQEIDRATALRFVEAFNDSRMIRASDGKRAFDFIITAYKLDDGVWTFELRSNGAPKRHRKSDIRITAP